MFIRTKKKVIFQVLERKYLGIIIGISILAVAIISYEYVLTSNLNTDEKKHEIPVNQTLSISHGKNYSISLNENVGLTSK